MRTVFFFIKQILTRTARICAFGLNHMVYSFSNIDPLDKPANFLAFLYEDSFDQEFNTKLRRFARIDSKSLLVFIKPTGVERLMPNLLGTNCQVLVIQELLQVPALLKALYKADKEIISLVFNLSQIPCHVVHGAKLDLDELSYCYDQTLAQILADIKKLSLGGQIIAICDQRELLGKKNSALFERLFMRNNTPTSRS